MTWVIVCEFRSREVPQVFQGSEGEMIAAFERLCTANPYRITLWEPLQGTKEMHEFARGDNSAQK